MLKPFATPTSHVHSNLLVPLARARVVGTALASPARPAPCRLAPFALPERSAHDPWRLRTAPLTQDFTLHVEGWRRQQLLVCRVNGRELRYRARGVADLYAMLQHAGDWVELGGVPEHKAARDGTVEAWARSASNPVRGWYGLTRGERGCFALFVPPLLELLGLCELQHRPRRNQIRVWR